MTTDTNPFATNSNPSAAGINSSTADINSLAVAGVIVSPILLVNRRDAPFNISLMSRQQGARAFVLFVSASLGAIAAINLTLKDALSGTIITRFITTAVKRLVEQHAYRGGTGCDRCHVSQEMKCALQFEESICDRCEKGDLVCQWSFAGEYGGRYHQERFGRVSLSEPYVDLWLNEVTASSASVGGLAHNEDGSEPEAPLPNAFDYYSAGEEESDEDEDEDDEEI